MNREASVKTTINYNLLDPRQRLIEGCVIAKVGGLLNIRQVDVEVVDLAHRKMRSNQLVSRVARRNRDDTIHIM